MLPCCPANCKSTMAWLLISHFLGRFDRGALGCSFGFIVRVWHTNTLGTRLSVFFSLIIPCSILFVVFATAEVIIFISAPLTDRYQLCVLVIPQATKRSKFFHSLVTDRTDLKYLASLLKITICVTLSQKDSRFCSPRLGHSQL